MLHPRLAFETLFAKIVNFLLYVVLKMVVRENFNTVWLNFYGAFCVALGVVYIEKFVVHIS